VQRQAHNAALISEAMAAEVASGRWGDASDRALAAAAHEARRCAADVEQLQFGHILDGIGDAAARLLKPEASGPEFAARAEHAGRVAAVGRHAAVQSARGLSLVSSDFAQASTAVSAHATKAPMYEQVYDFVASAPSDDGSASYDFIGSDDALASIAGIEFPNVGHGGLGGAPRLNGREKRRAERRARTAAAAAPTAGASSSDTPVAGVVVEPSEENKVEPSVEDAVDQNAERDADECSSESGLYSMAADDSEAALELLARDEDTAADVMASLAREAAPPFLVARASADRAAGIQSHAIGSPAPVAPTAAVPSGPVSSPAAIAPLAAERVHSSCSVNIAAHTRPTPAGPVTSPSPAVARSSPTSQTLSVKALSVKAPFATPSATRDTTDSVMGELLGDSEEIASAGTKEPDSVQRSRSRDLELTLPPLRDADFSLALAGDTLVSQVRGFSDTLFAY
jgi:hypothetical protein